MPVGAHLFPGNGSWPSCLCHRMLVASIRQKCSSVLILPWLIGLIIPFGASTGLLLVSSAGLLIVVGVVRDTFFNIEAELKLHGYDDTLLIR